MYEYALRWKILSSFPPKQVRSLFVHKLKQDNITAVSMPPTIRSKVKIPQTVTYEVQRPKNSIKAKRI